MSERSEHKDAGRNTESEHKEEEKKVNEQENRDGQRGTDEPDSTSSASSDQQAEPEETKGTPEPASEPVKPEEGAEKPSMPAEDAPVATNETLPEDKVVNESNEEDPVVEADQSAGTDENEVKEIAMQAAVEQEPEAELPAEDETKERAEQDTAGQTASEEKPVVPREEIPEDIRESLQQDEAAPRSTPPDPVAEADKDPEVDENEVGEVAMQEAVEKEPETDLPTGEETAGQQEATADDASDDPEEEDEQEHIDYTALSREELLKFAKGYGNEGNLRKADREMKALKSALDDREEELRTGALEKFKAEGGEEADFEFRHDEIYEEIDRIFKSIRDQRSKQMKVNEATREENLKRKQDILEKMRELVDSEETDISIKAIKELQQEFRETGPVPAAYNRNLWGNYNALITRFYDKRSIYFELKELDRKKNLDLKLQLCERAEQLLKLDNVKQMVKELDELHEEYKHIGPVPRDDQEPTWQRFKAASDAIHELRREQTEAFKKELQENLAAKQAIAEQVQSFVDFDSESIQEWNQKTQELLNFQKQWEAIGRLPRAQAREVNKSFWSVFKKFFANKGAFFKKLDARREEHLQMKEELVQQAEALKESTEWEETANKLKELQRRWREIGPVPEKHKDDVYKRFKKACDTFFNNRRAQHAEQDAEYQKNLEAKEAICGKIEAMQDEAFDKDQLIELAREFQGIGFVPRKAIKAIQRRYEHALDEVLNKAKDLDEAEERDIRFKIQLTRMKQKGGNQHRKMNNKEQAIRKQISRLEDDIANWRNNLNFFTVSSKQGAQLTSDFEDRIEKAEKEVKMLRQQLKTLRKVAQEE